MNDLRSRRRVHAVAFSGRQARVGLLAVLSLAAGSALPAMAQTTAAPTRQVVHQLTFTGRRSLTDLAAHAALASGAGIPQSATNLVTSPNLGPPSPPTRVAHRPAKPNIQTNALRGDTTGQVLDTPRPVLPDAGPAFSGLPGIRAADNRFANNQAGDFEPPDQAICTGGGRVVEAVNSAVTVYSGLGTGRQFVPAISTNDLFGVPREFPEGGPFGTALTDPTCLFDQDVQRFFLVVTGFGLNPSTGDPDGTTDLYVAVSSTSDPLGDWATFTVDTSQGDEFDPPGCPCIDDFPHIGADATGFFISTNRWTVSPDRFVNAKVHAMSKRALAGAADGSGPADPRIVTVTPGPAGGSPAFTLQAAITPPGAPFPPNREYFLSTTNATTAGDKRIALWALSNTASLDALAVPVLDLSVKITPSLPYSDPSSVPQKPGPAPLASELGEPLAPLDGSSAQFNESPMFAGGSLWGTVPTAVAAGPDGTPRNGFLWVQVRPTFDRRQVAGQIAAQGYVSVARDSLLFPAVAVNAAGKGAIVFTVAGLTRYPSAAYIEMGPAGPTGPVRIVAPGAGPEDGFSCYQAFGPTTQCRWGDYSAARVDEHGDVWLATEYIPPLARSSVANWGTFWGRLHL